MKYRTSSGMRASARLGAVLAAACLVVTACGSDGSDPSSDSPTDDPSSGSTSGDPIKIGFATNITGPLSSSGVAAPAAAKAWQESVNAEGGLGGRPVEIVFEDTKNAAPASQAALQKLADDPDIVAVMLFDSVTDGAVADFAQGLDVPIIGHGYEETAWNNHTNFFPTSASRGTVAMSRAIATKAAGAKVMSIGACTEAPSCIDDANKVIKPKAEELGMTYGTTAPITGTAPNFTAECLGLIKAKTDFIEMGLPPANGTRLVQDCKQQGYTGPFGVSSTGFNPNDYKSISDLQMASSLNAFPWWSKSEGATAYRDALSKYQKDVPFTSSSGTATWASLELFKKALGDNTDTVTRDSVFDAYWAIKDETLGGLLPQPITFTEGENAPVVKCFWQWKWDTKDPDPTTIAPDGESGNGNTDDLATACVD